MAVSETYAVEAAQEPSGTFDFSTAKSVADSAQSSACVPGMNNTRSNRPASQSRAKQSERFQSRRGLAEPVKGNSSSGTVASAEVVEMTNNDGSEMVKSQSLRSTTLLQPGLLSRNPLVPVINSQSERTTPLLSKKRPGPAIHHVPGSYRSEHDLGLDFEPAMAGNSLPTATESVPSVDESFLKRGLPKPTGLESPPTLNSPVSMTDKLQPVSRSDTVIRIRKSVSSLQARPEQTVDGALSPQKPNHHLMLLKPSALPSDTGVPAPPILTSGFGNSHAPDEISKDVKPDGNSTKRPEKPEKLQSTPDEQLAADYHEQSVDAVGKPLAKLLSELPPMKQGVVDDFRDQHLTAKIITVSPVPTYDYDTASRYSHSQESVKGSISQSVSRDYTVKRSDSYKSLVRHIDPLSRTASSIALDRSKPRLSANSADLTLSVKRSLLELQPQSISRTSSLETTQLTPQQAVAVPNLGQYPQERVHSEGNPSKKHWIRSFLQRAPQKQSPQSPSPNLTARPADRMISNASGGTTMSLDGKDSKTGGLDASSAKELEATERSSADRVQRSDYDYQRRTSESFSKIILELEELLNEAILVARQAAEQNANEELPGILEEAALVLKGGDATKPYAAARNQRSSDAFGQANGLDIEGQAATHEATDTFVSESAFETDLASSPDSEQHAGATRLGHSHIQPAVNSNQSPPFAISKHAPVMYNQGESQPNDPANLPVKSNTTTPRRFYASSDCLDWANSASQQQDDGPPNALIRRRSSILNRPSAALPPAKDSFSLVARGSRDTSQIPSKDSVHEHIRLHREPPIQPRMSSSQLRTASRSDEEGILLRLTQNYHPDYRDGASSSMRSPTAGTSQHGQRHNPKGYGTTTVGDPGPAPRKRDSDVQGHETDKSQETGNDRKGYSLRDRHHFSIREPQGFSISRSHRHQPIARDWSDRRKRYVAAVACISTALIGLIVGIYVSVLPSSPTTRLLTCTRLVRYRQYSTRLSIFITTRYWATCCKSML